MYKKIEKIYELSKKRIYHLHNEDNKGFYKGYKTYIEGIQDELEEAKCEIKEKNSVYLEDELGDIFWDYLCLLHSLEEDKLINSKKVFDRCYKKFSERLENNPGPGEWNKVKKKQKEENKCEHEKLYN